MRLSQHLASAIFERVFIQPEGSGLTMSQAAGNELFKMTLEHKPTSGQRARTFMALLSMTAMRALASSETGSPAVKAIQVYAPTDQAFVVVEPQFNLADPYGAGWPPGLDTGMARVTPAGRIAAASGARYLGFFPLPQFINLVDQCALVVTAVTMAMHITIGLNKKIVLFNNIFNRHEFELYGLGEVLEPGVPCTCYYSPECPNNCMQYITVERDLASCVRLLGR